MAKDTSTHLSASRRSWIPGTATLMGLVGFFVLGYAATNGWTPVFTHGLAGLPLGYVWGVALVGGAASFFSPCGLALTPAFFGVLMGQMPTDGLPLDRVRLVRGSLCARHAAPVAEHERSSGHLNGNMTLPVQNGL